MQSLMNGKKLLIQEYENRLGIRFPEDDRFMLVKQLQNLIIKSSPRPDEPNN